MKCGELLALLNDYVDGTSGRAICQQIEAHIAACDPCQVVLDNIRNTITLYKHGEPYEVPESCRERLHQALRERWGENREAKGSGENFKFVTLSNPGTQSSTE